MIETLKQPAGRAEQAALEELTRINSDDLLKAFGLAGVRRGRELLLRLCRRPALRLARQVTTCDAIVGDSGLQAGGEWALRQFVRRSAVSGADQVPERGPVLIVANHPGLYDTVALFAAIPRDDLRILAATRPFLEQLPNVSRHLISIDEASNDRVRVVRAATRHLRAGGAVLLFPGGKIEPDPAVLPGAVAALGEWSGSIELFARLEPRLTVIPAIVSSVLSSAALRHPLVRLRRAEADRQLLAATLQIVFPGLQRGSVRVDFGSPIGAAGAGSSLGALVTAEAARVMGRVAKAPDDR